jgi:xanthine dehydrogenase small subunit
MSQTGISQTAMEQPVTVEQISLMINGDRIELSNVSPTLTLLRYLQQSGRTGTKEGCGDGDCGACTVAIVAPGADGKPGYQAVNSCLIPVAAVAGREIITVEGIATGETLHPVQAAMVATGGSQCGYCTPGFIMSLFAAYYGGELDDGAMTSGRSKTIEGNLCRCTGYLPIRRAAQQLARAEGADRFESKIAQPILPIPALNYVGNQQQFYRPSNLATVLELLQQLPQAQLIAGGTDLGLAISHDRQPFPVLISLEAVAELQTIGDRSDAIRIGAAVPLSQLQRQLQTEWQGLFPSLAEMLHWFAARQVRNRATIGGNLGTASPIGDLPPVLLALDATVEVASLQGDRPIPIGEFFLGYRQTALRSGEVIVAITIPKLLSNQAVRRFNQSYKVGKRGTDDISIVAAAFTIDVDADHRICHARLAYGGVAATPIRAIAVEEFLVGKPWTMATIAQVKPMLRETFTPLSDLRGTAEYRKMLVANLWEKFFVEMSEFDRMED